MLVEGAVRCWEHGTAYQAGGPHEPELMHTATGSGPMYACSDEQASMCYHVFLSEPWGLDITTVSFI